MYKCDFTCIEICDLFANGNGLDAADRSAELIETGIYDIRLISFVLVQAFVEDGCVMWEPIFGGLSTFVEKHWDSFGPLERKEQHFGKSIVLLIKRIQERCVYHEQKKDEVWEDENGKTVSTIAYVKKENQDDFRDLLMDEEEIN